MCWLYVVFDRPFSIAVRFCMEIKSCCEWRSIIKWNKTFSERNRVFIFLLIYHQRWPRSRIFTYPVFWIPVRIEKLLRFLPKPVVFITTIYDRKKIVARSCLVSSTEDSFIVQERCSILASSSIAILKLWFLSTRQ